jgi:hypothetical protein
MSSSSPAPTAAGSNWSPPWNRRLPKRAVRCAVLLLEAGLIGGALYLSWWHFEWTNGDTLPPDQRQLTVPMITWGLGHARTQLLLALPWSPCSRALSG